MAKRSSLRSMSRTLAFAVCAGCLLSCAKVEKHVRHFFALDTVIDVTVYTASGRVDGDMDSVQALIERFEERLSISKPESEIYKINHRIDSTATVSQILSAILSVSRKEYAVSGGLFDVTVEPLKLLYGLESHQTSNHVPTQKELDSVLLHIGFDKIRFISDSVFILPPGMRLDFGGIAKGCVLREVERLLVKKGYASFLVNAGGDMIAHGIKPSKTPWSIGVQHPRKEDRMIATLAVRGGCVFTSGDYERCFVVNGKRYHHLFDPRTGLPGSYNMSATVLGDDPLIVDAAVKTAFLMPAGKALDYLASRSLLGLIIDANGIGWASAGLKSSCKPDTSFIVNYR